MSQSRFFEMRPIKYVLSGRLLFLFSLQLLRFRYRSVALFQGVSLHKATSVNCPLGAYGVAAFSGCHSPPAAFSMQNLSFNQEAFRVFRPED
jgi:hypothetical protein